MTTKPGDIISILDVALGADESGNAQDQLNFWSDNGDFLMISARDGSRWIVTATPYPLSVTEADHYVAQALIDAGRAIYGKARPRARTVGGPAVECIVEKQLIDSLGPIIGKIEASNVLGLQAIEAEGAQAHRDGISIEAGPVYLGPIGPRCAMAWRAGWLRAAKEGKES